MKKLILYIITTIIITITACINSTKVSSELTGCWVESNRENNIITMLHCADYTPGPARHFYRFSLNDNGHGTYFHLSPNDAHKDVPIRWKAENDVLYIKSERVDKKFSIREINESSLKLTSIHD